MRIKNTNCQLDSPPKVKVLVTQSCLTLCDLMNCSPPGSPVRGIFQPKILEWVAIPFSCRAGSRPPTLAPPSHRHTSAKCAACPCQGARAPSMRGQQRDLNVLCGILFQVVSDSDMPFPSEKKTRPKSLHGELVTSRQSGFPTSSSSKMLHPNLDASNSSQTRTQAYPWV